MILLSVDTGGPELGEATSQLHVQCNRLLKKHCSGSYSTAVAEFMPVLRISGSIANFKFSGVEKLRFQKKAGSITIDMGIQVGEVDWADVDICAGKVADLLEEAFDAMIARILNDKIDLDERALRRDITTVCRKLRTDELRPTVDEIRAKRPKV